MTKNTDTTERTITVRPLKLSKAQAGEVAALTRSLVVGTAGAEVTFLDGVLPIFASLVGSASDSRPLDQVTYQSIHKAHEDAGGTYAAGQLSARLRAAHVLNEAGIAWSDHFADVDAKRPTSGVAALGRWAAALWNEETRSKAIKRITSRKTRWSDEDSREAVKAFKSTSRSQNEEDRAKMVAERTKQVGMTPTRSVEDGGAYNRHSVADLVAMVRDGLNGLHNVDRRELSNVAPQEWAALVESAQALLDEVETAVSERIADENATK
jgi:hypothetical protein